MASHAEIQRYKKASPDSYPLTRRALLWFLWENVCPHVDILKCGMDQYVLQIGTRQVATHVRALHTCTLGWWDKFVRSEVQSYNKDKGKELTLL